MLFQILSKHSRKRLINKLNTKEKTNRQLTNILTFSIITDGMLTIQEHKFNLQEKMLIII